MEEIEHPEGTSEIDMKIREHDFMKETLAKRMGVSTEKFEDMLNEAKELFNLRKKDIIKDFKKQDSDSLAG